MRKLAASGWRKWPRARMAAALLAVACLLGCAGTPLRTLPGAVGIEPVTPSMTDRAFTVWVWLRHPHDTIQSVTEHAGWEGVEYHPQPMWRPDKHSRTFDEPPAYYVRDMRVRAGTVRGVRVAPWGVALLHGWPPHFNAETQRWVGQQGEIASEQPATETRWRIEFWGTADPPKLRISCVDTGAFLEWPRPRD